MRELKFRAWDSDIKQMLPPQDLSQSKEYWEWLGVADVVLMQYTGLKDKNGKEIYEGDIVRLKNKPDEVGAEHMQGIYPVRYSQEELRFCGEPYTTLTWGGTESVEIIGNIYENPELINK